MKTHLQAIEKKSKFLVFVEKAFSQIIEEMVIERDKSYYYSKHQEEKY